MPSLAQKLTEALESRDQRLIRRRLPPIAPSSLVDFNSNDYLSLARSPVLRDLFLNKLRAAPDVLGSGGSRLLVNGSAHAALEARLTRFFGAPAALLFNSGFDANASLFACVPQPGDVAVCDEYIHASVHDGVRASRVHPAARYAFEHNSLRALRGVLRDVCREHAGALEGKCNVFVAVESVYSMEGTIAPLKEIVELVEITFPHGNGYVIVDEAHATGVYGPQGKGLVAMLGLESRVFARLHTFGKALAATGAVILTSELVKDYLLNYARPLVFTTSLSCANIILADCSFDLLEEGTTGALAATVLRLSDHFVSTFRCKLHHVPVDLLRLPPHLDDPAINNLSMIIPIMTSQPRPLSAHLYARGINTRPITWPTVPKGKDRVRVCLHAGNTREEVEALVDAMVDWAREMLQSSKHSCTVVTSKL